MRVLSSSRSHRQPKEHGDGFANFKAESPERHDSGSARPRLDWRHQRLADRRDTQTRRKRAVQPPPQSRGRLAGGQLRNQHARALVRHARARRRKPQDPESQRTRARNPRAHPARELPADLYRRGASARQFRRQRRTRLASRGSPRASNCPDVAVYKLRFGQLGGLLWRKIANTSKKFTKTSNPAAKAARNALKWAIPGSTCGVVLPA